MLTKAGFAQFREDLLVATKDLAEKYDINIETGNINYDKFSFSMNLKVMKKTVNGESFEKSEFKKLCNIYGFKLEDYNKEFIYDGESYRLIGFNPRAKTMPVLAKNTEGKTFKFRTNAIKL